MSVSSPLSVTDPKLGTLPLWDLSVFYMSKDDPKIDADLEALGHDAQAFKDRYAEKVEGLDASALTEAVQAYEQLLDRLYRPQCYASLLYAEDLTADGVAAFRQKVSEAGTAVYSTMLFFTLELKRISDERFAEMMAASTGLAHYRAFIEDIQIYRPFQLSDELEGYIVDMAPAGAGAWSRLFDETVADLRFNFRGEELTSAQVLHKLSDGDESVRKDAAKVIGEVFHANGRLFATITNTLAKMKQLGDDKRGYARPVSSRNLANAIEDEVVDALVDSVDAAYPDLSHRYYRLKAKWMGKETLNYWDRNAPLPTREDRQIPWAEAEQTVISAYNAFSPELGSIGAQFFEKNWIDAPTRPGKSPGAFSAGCTPSSHPFILMNYQGKVRDVMTLAHELGHGVHQVLSAEQGLLQANAPLTLAETASVFGEMLTFQSLLNATTDPAAKKVLLAGKVEDMLNTVVRQIAFHQFETRVHDARKQGELSTEQLGDIWMDVQRASLGDAITYDDNYRSYWMYIPHFIHSPFYVYAYAFGDCLVNSLYAVYQDAEDGFADKYFEMLRAGGSKRHKELLAPFGLDASDPAFWQRGLKMISGFIDQLEAMED